MEEFDSAAFYAGIDLGDESPEEAKAAEKKADRLREWNEDHR